jgi:hypothetical protein
MDTLAEKLDARLREWKPETAAEARERIAEVIDLADHDVLDVARSRAAEQEVLDLLPEAIMEQLKDALVFALGLQRASG